MWIPELTSPMNIISYNETSSECFGELFEVKVNTEKTPDQKDYIISKKGVKVSVFGQTNQTKVSTKNRF